VVEPSHQAVLQEAVGLNMAKAKAEITFGMIWSGGNGIRCGRLPEV
jgi:hypothetical protein